MFYLAHSVLRSEFFGWRDPASYLNGSPEELRERLTGGYGLLARGPRAAMAALAAAVGPLFRVQTVESHTLQSTAMALTFDNQFVICDSVEVLPDGGQPSAPADAARRVSTER